MPELAAFSLTIKYSDRVNLIQARISFLTVFAGRPALFVLSLTGSISLHVLLVLAFSPYATNGSIGRALLSGHCCPTTTPLALKLRKSGLLRTPLNVDLSVDYVLTDRWPLLIPYRPFRPISFCHEK